VHIIVGLGSGSASDLITRLVGQKLSEQLGQPVVIENRPGASGTLAAELVVRASPDGYTLLLTNSADAVNATLNDTLSFNIVRDIVGIASFGTGPLIQVVHPSFPAKTVPEFIAYAKANPGKISFGSAGTGSLVQLAGELFKARAGIDMVHVPYRGGMVAALTDLIGGRVQVVFSTLPPAIEQVRAGKLRALAVTSKARSEALPDVPTIGDFLSGYEASFSNGLGAPRNTPDEIVEKLNKEINIVLAKPDIKARLSNLGIVAEPMTVTDYGKFRANEVEKWRKVIRAANIRPE
jgi:tripartite-type tricarboxylate transporter receptor subunit TctC